MARWLDPPSTITRRPTKPTVQENEMWENDQKEFIQSQERERMHTLRMFAADQRLAWAKEDAEINLQVGAEMLQGKRLAEFERVATEALCLKMGGDVRDKNGRVDGDAVELSRMSLGDIGRWWCQHLGIADHQTRNDLELWGNLMNSRAWLQHIHAKKRLGLSIGTSDFPQLLAGGLLAVCKGELKTFEPTWWAYGRREELKNFKTHGAVGLEPIGVLEETGELEEWTSDASITERNVDISLKSYTRRFGLTRQAVTNDEGALFAGEIGRELAAAARRTEDDAMVELLEGAPTCGDGVALFNEASHNNDIAGAFGGDGVGTARQRLRDQVASDGVTKTNTEAATLLIPSPYEHSAHVFAEAIGEQGRLQIVVEPRLASGVYYVVADQRQAPCLIGSYLRGTAGVPEIVTAPSTRSPDVLNIWARHAFGVSVHPAGWRGIVRVTTGE